MGDVKGVCKWLRLSSIGQFACLSIGCACVLYQSTSRSCFVDLKMPPSPFTHGLFLFEVNHLSLLTSDKTIPLTQASGHTLFNHTIIL